MRDLWKGLTMLTVDEELRKQVASKALCVKKTTMAPMFDMQPDVNALREIDSLFRRRGLVLSAYALAEINRWFFGDLERHEDHQKEFLNALGSLQDAIKESFGPGFNGFNARSPGFMEAVGVLVADPELRDHFLKNTMNLREHGFQLSSEEEEALRRDFESGSPAIESAKKIHELGWGPESYCSSRLLVYDKLFHFNQ